MIAFSSNEPRDVAPYLASLARFCASGNLVAGWERRPGGNHPNGWGVAWRAGDEIRMVKSGNPAASDPLLSDVHALTDRFIGHVRYASNPETVCAANSHPFQALGVTLAHNGTFYGKIGAEGDARKVSDTVVFLELLEDRWVERTLAGLSETLRGILSDRELVGEYSAANLLIATGDALFAFRVVDAGACVVLALPDLHRQPGALVQQREQLFINAIDVGAQIIDRGRARQRAPPKT